MGNIKERGIQNYIYYNLEKTLGNIDFTYFEQGIDYIDLINFPTKFLFYKHILSFQEAISSIKEGMIYKFPLEFNTAELDSYKPRVDIMFQVYETYNFDGSLFVVEIKNDKQPERETLTELFQYSN